MLAPLDYRRKGGKKALNVTSGSSLNAVLVQSHFPCLCSLCKQNLLFLNLHPGHNWVASCLKNTHAGRKNFPPATHAVTSTTYIALGLLFFFPVLGQILWLAFHSYSVSLIFTFTLKRFISHFLQYYFRVSNPTVRHLHVPNVSAAKAKMQT